MIKRIINTAILLFLLIGSVYCQESATIDSDSGCNVYADFIFRDSSSSESDYTYFFQAVYYQPAAGETIDYVWGFPDGSSAFDSSAMHTFAEEGVYEVSLSLTDNSGCTDSIRRKIPVSRELMPPNVFTPNGDGLNDIFEVSTQGDYLYKFRIFTRTGTQVHFSQSSRIVWDGRTVGGSELPEGIYYYMIESSDTPVETEVSGFIHLYR
jgi:gliding motility-associated-like protein